MKRIIPILGLAVALPLAACSEDDNGPMGLSELTTTKFIVFGQGQVRS